MYRSSTAVSRKGFTIVELLIVIVVIAILAAITTIAYNGMQDRARNSQIENDLSLLQKAIRSAQVNRGETALRYITPSTATASPCVYLANDVDLAQNNSTTSSCWTAYNSSLNNISDASGINIRNLKDPWGRPYFIDENEQESGPCGSRDQIGAYYMPHQYGNWNSYHRRNLPYITPGC